MIKFERYPHVNEFITHYLKDFDDLDVIPIMQSGVNSEQDAVLFSKFIWKMVDKIHQDEEEGISVLGSHNNIDILPDVSYEVTSYMRKVGHFATWDKILDTFILE